MVVLAFAAAAASPVACGGRFLQDASRIDASTGDGPDAIASGPSGASGGRCGSTPKELVDLQAVSAQTNAGGINASTPIAVDATSLYFVMGYTLLRVPIEGGGLSVLAHLPNPSPPDVIVAQNVQPYVTSTEIVLHLMTTSSNDKSEQIVSVPIRGGSPTALATSNGSILGFAISGPSIYFVDGAGTKTVATGGGPVRLLNSQVASAASGLAVVGSQVVVTEAEQGAVVAVPVGGGPPTTLATQQPNANFPLACGSDICWWTGATPGTFGISGPGAIGRLDAKGNVGSLPGAAYSPWGLVFDGSSFFEAVGCDVCPGSILRIPLTGAFATVTSGGSVAVDDQCLYFSTLQAYPPVDAGSEMGIFSVAKAYVTCCDASGSCVFTTGSCPAAVDAATD